MTCDHFGSVTTLCCESCHQDKDWGFPMQEFTTSDGVEVEVCCTVHHELERRFGNLERVHSAMLPAAKWTRPWVSM